MTIPTMGRRLSSRRYIKRVWRVPKDRGAPTYLAALVCKLMVKHGWPAMVELCPGNWGDGFIIKHKFTGDEAASDFWEAAETAVRIVGRTYSVDFETPAPGVVMIPDEYRVTAGGFVKKVKP